MSKVTVCGVVTGSLPRLTAAESNELLIRIENGDAEAKELFVRANMRLVLSVVGRFSASRESADDLFQAGMVGLMKSISGFDRSYGMRFSTYAVPMIIGEIRRSLRDRTGIKVPRSLRDTAYKALKAREKLTENSLKDPDLDEIAQEIGVDFGQVACALDAVSEPMSLSEPAFSDEEDGMRLIDKIADDKENAENWSEHIALEEALKLVPERELAVIRMRYFEGKTQNEISERVGVSQAQVSRLEKSAVARLKAMLM